MSPSPSEPLPAGGRLNEQDGVATSNVAGIQLKQRIFHHRDEDLEAGRHNRQPSEDTTNEPTHPLLQFSEKNVSNGTGDDRPASSPTKPPVAAKGTLLRYLDSCDPRLKFAVLVSFVMVFFGLHNLLQEKLSKMKDFTFDWSLGMMEALGVLFGSFAERVSSGEVGKRVSPFRNYALLAGLLAMSSSLANIALNYIEYPTRVIFRSCKLLPTMAIAVIWRKRLVSRWEFMAAAAVCTGLVIFAQTDAELEPDFDPRGIVMVVVSVCADAFLPNLQEHIFSLGASRIEVTFYSNLLAAVGMLLSTTANGNLFEFLPYASRDISTLSHMVAYAMLSHIAISSHMMVVKEYGSVTAVLVGNTRKAMTIALSYALFPKPFSYRFVMGGALVLGGLAANVMIKERRREATGRAKQARSMRDMKELCPVSKGNQNVDGSLAECGLRGQDGDHLALHSRRAPTNPGETAEIVVNDGGVLLGSSSEGETRPLHTSSVDTSCPGGISVEKR